MKLLCRLLYVCALAVLASCGDNQNAQPVDLTCEFVTNPLGVEISNPRLHWTIRSGESDFVQKAFQVRVASSIEKLQAGEADVFDSGKQTSGEMTVVAQLKNAASYSRYYWAVTVWDEWGSKCMVSEPSWFETAKLQGIEGWSGQWISDHNDKEYRPAPIFRKNFDLKEKPVQARAYVCGLGYCSFFLNGEKIGRGTLDPGYTDFQRRVLYMTYDVTAQLQPGTNNAAAELGNGWFNNQTGTVWHYEKAPWRARPQMLCEIHVTYADGSKEVINSDETWKTSTGALQYDNLYTGAYYDARKEQKGWNTASFDDAKWDQVKIVNSPAPLIQSQMMPEIGIARTFKPAWMKTVAPNTYLYYMGENFAGVAKLKIKGAAGTKVTMSYGELLANDGRLSQANINMHLRADRPDEKQVQTDIYYLSGEGEESYTPPYTYHGYQYLEITADKPITLDENSVEGVVLHSLVEPIGSFECSDELLNKIYDNCKRSYLSNLFGIPTDCPHREKNGWMADGFMVQEAGMMNYDSRDVYAKWVNDFTDAQMADGNVPGVIPASWNWDSNWAGPIWDAAIFIVPDLLHRYYGDIRAYEAIYPVCKRYIDYLDKTRNEKGLVNHGLGDWLFYKAITPVDFMTTCYFYQDCMTMSKMSQILGKGEEQIYLTKAEELKKIINEQFFDQENCTYSNKTQLSYALPLYMGVVPEEYRVKVAANLAKAITENDFSLDFGFIGSAVVPQVLSDYGYNDVMFKLATKTTMPSYGYWVKEWNATSLFETWDITRNIGDASLNHPSMGSISAWMMKSLGGINVDGETITIAPSFVEGLDYAKTSYKSVFGMIATDWKRTDQGIQLTVTIPANTKANLVLKGKTQTIGSGTQQFIVQN